MVHSVSGCTRGVQVKLWYPLRTRANPERLRDVITTRRYTSPRLPYLACEWALLKRFSAWEVKGQGRVWMLQRRRDTFRLCNDEAVLLILWVVNHQTWNIWSLKLSEAVDSSYVRLTSDSAIFDCVEYSDVMRELQTRNSIKVHLMLDIVQICSLFMLQLQICLWHIDF